MGNSYHRVSSPHSADRSKASGDSNVNSSSANYHNLISPDILWVGNLEPSNAMDISRLYFTTLDDIVVVADEDMNVILNNYCTDLHDYLFSGLKYFAKLKMGKSEGEYSLSSCFPTIPTTLILDQLTILNLRAITEMISTCLPETLSNMKISADTISYCQSLKTDLMKDQNESLLELEKQMKNQNLLDILRFLNIENTTFKDEVTVSFVEMVACLLHSK